MSAERNVVLIIEFRFSVLLARTDQFHARVIVETGGASRTWKVGIVEGIVEHPKTQSTLARFEIGKQRADVHDGIGVAARNAEPHDGIAPQIGTEVDVRRLARNLVLACTPAIQIQVDRAAAEFNARKDRQRIGDAGTAEGLLEL